MLIGLTGYQQVGKDTIAEYLESKYGFEHLRFADKLKDSVAALLRCTREEIEKWKNEDMYVVCVTSRQVPVSKTQTFREFLQRYGTESHREIFGYDFWLDALLPMSAKRFQTGRYVISDVRFRNEMDRVYYHGGAIWQVVRPGYERRQFHISEEIPIYYNLQIENDEDLDSLYKKVDEAVLMFAP